MPAGWEEVANAAGEMYGGGAEDSMALIAAPEGAVRKETAADGDGDQTGTPKGEDEADGGNSGGCSSTGTSAGSSGLFLLMALASLLVLAVRRETVKVR